MDSKKLEELKEQYIHQTLVNAHDALKEKGYDAKKQLMEYLFTDDPGYLTSYKDTRQNLCAVERDELMLHILRHYFEN